MQWICCWSPAVKELFHQEGGDDRPQTVRSRHVSDTTPAIEVYPGLLEDFRRPYIVDLPLQVRICQVDRNSID